MKMMSIDDQEEEKFQTFSKLHVRNRFKVPKFKMKIDKLNQEDDKTSQKSKKNTTEVNFFLVKTFF